MIEIKNVCKSFDGKEILKDISAVMQTGLTNLIIGTSGSGKWVAADATAGVARAPRTLPPHTSVELIPVKALPVRVRSLRMTLPETVLFVALISA